MHTFGQHYLEAQDLFPHTSLSHITVHQDARLLVTFWLNLLVLTLLLRASSHVFLDIPTNTIPSTSKSITCFTQSLSFILPKWPNQRNVSVLIALLIHSIPSLLLGSKTCWDVSQNSITSSRSFINIRICLHL